MNIKEKLTIKILDFLIRLSERDMLGGTFKPFDDKKKESFYANLWVLPGFREYYKERDELFKSALSNGISSTEGTPLELPVRSYIRLWSQRAENALLARKALNAFKNSEDKLNKKS